MADEQGRNATRAGPTSAASAAGAGSSTTEGERGHHNLVVGHIKQVSNANFGSNYGTINQVTTIHNFPTSLPPALIPIPDASHTRNRRISPPDSACMPGTRQDAIQRISAWAADDEGEWVELEDLETDSDDESVVKASWPGRKPILWLCGPVGCGKSAISQAVAEIFASRRLLLGSFFFFRGAGDRSRIAQLAVTLATQMKSALPATAPLVEAALRLHGVEAMSAGDQLRLMVLKPLQIAFEQGNLAPLPANTRSTQSTALPTQYPPVEPPPVSPPRKGKSSVKRVFRGLLRRFRGRAVETIEDQDHLTALSPAPPLPSPSRTTPANLATLPQSPFLIILDGVDECDDRVEIASLIDDIISFLKQHPNFPLRVLIASRIEEHIRARIETDEVHIENLRDHYSRGDILTVVRSTFQAAAKGSLVIRSYGQQWPPEDELYKLVDHADGSFIFITTLLKYILDLEGSQQDGLTPMKRFRLALDMDPGLDNLYENILAVAKHMPYFCDVVYTLALLQSPISVSSLAVILDIPTYEIVNVLVPLQSIIHIPGDDDSAITTFHASLDDFIRDEERSKCVFSSDERGLTLTKFLHACLWITFKSFMPLAKADEQPQLHYVLVSVLQRRFKTCWEEQPCPVEPPKMFAQALLVKNASNPRIQMACRAYSAVLDCPAHRTSDHRCPHPSSSTSWIPRVLQPILCCLASSENRIDSLEILETVLQKSIGEPDPSLHRCIIMHAMFEMLYHTHTHTSNVFDCAYYVWHWFCHLPLAIESSSTNDDATILQFLQQPYSPTQRQLAAYAPTALPDGSTGIGQPLWTAARLISYTDSIMDVIEARFPGVVEPTCWAERYKDRIIKKGPESPFGPGTELAIEIDADGLSVLDMLNVYRSLPRMSLFFREVILHLCPAQGPGYRSERMVDKLNLKSVTGNGKLTSSM
ncbi:hypothetical protein NMY22_g13878 [Coprinellus aureogranulatus]|nr:hypothetical protein NMY22_g13878 [Coprinellus aureogranulatus]